MDSTMRDMTKSRKVQRVRTFTGCWKCRSRKVRCDRLSPECTPCQKLGIACNGYDVKLVWVTDGKSYVEKKRRMLPPELTWSGCKLFRAGEVDRLIERCDAGQPIICGPFSVFAAHEEVPSLSSLCYKQGMSDETDECEAFLFRHYIDHIAPIMMPLHDKRNPWRTLYPQQARHGHSKGSVSLFYGMLAQAAANLARLQPDGARVGLLSAEYYTRAVHELRESISEGNIDFGIFMASVLTLIMAEAYNGGVNAGAWRIHLDNAWGFFLTYTKNKKYPWEESDFAWTTAQSLCLLRLRCSTTRYQSDEEIQLLQSVAIRPDLGFTIGADPALAYCLIHINTLKQQIQNGIPIQSFEADVASLLRHLNDSYFRSFFSSTAKNMNITYDSEDALYHHTRLLQAGLLIHLHRSLLFSAPSRLTSYVTGAFYHEVAFRATSFANAVPTLFPLFLAACEACIPSTKNAARAWLQRAKSSGIGNREEIESVVEGVWKQRGRMARELGVLEGDVVLGIRETVDMLLV